MRIKRIPLLFSKPSNNITADPSNNFGVQPIRRAVRSHEDKRHIVIETFDKAGFRRIQVVLLLSVVDDVAHILRGGVVTALCLDAVTNAYHIQDGMPVLELIVKKCRFDA
ncbi:hypothetical protein D0Y60_13265 [Shinella sp. WSJ-2]|uniref:hypothetical protein n=1 Tax=Shinella sp. WSJ-2 TaxID=2303749 RepID=UPI000E3B5C35|nr:hypothetical protein [Shinella sp. WSJ-2]RFZ86964.1 hypothetical protein D0Y60_13265 [Shinella sp. WSJ-2]